MPGVIMFEKLRFFSRVGEMLAWRRRPPARLRARRQRRWRRLLRHAYDHSPFYGERLRGLDLGRCRPADLPPLTKAEMMANFDAVVTDRRIRQAHVERFVADPAN